MDQHNPGRSALQAVVRDALTANAQVDAAWEGGSAAFGSTDEFSDVDAVAIAADDHLAEVFAGVEQALARLAPVALRYDVPDSPGFTQKFYRLEGFPDYQVLDLVLFRRSDPLLFREVELHGHGEVWFDRTGVLTERHCDFASDLEKARRRVPILRDAFAMFQHIPTKERKRGRAVEALFFYHSMTYRPLTEALRLLYCPHLRIFSVRYLARDLPAAVVALLTDLAFVADLDELAVKHARAQRIFDDAMAILERDGPGRLGGQSTAAAPGWLARVPHLRPRHLRLHDATRAAPIANSSASAVRRVGPLAGLLLVASLSCVCAHSVAAERCHYTKRYTVPIATTAHSMDLAGSVNGVATRMKVDTGVPTTLLSRQFAESQNLPIKHSDVTLFGVAGAAETHIAQIDEIQIGPMHGTKAKLLVDWDSEAWRPPVIVGSDIWYRDDLEISVREGVLRVFHPEGCKDSFLAYWDANAASTEILANPPDENRVFIAVKINEHEFRAVIDTGAALSVIDAPAAERLGVTPQSPGVAKGPDVIGFGGRTIPTLVARFETLVIGEETIGKPRLYIANIKGAAIAEARSRETAKELEKEADVILGLDFLRSHRVLLSVSQHVAYFSHVTPEAFVDDSRSASP